MLSRLPIEKGDLDEVELEALQELLSDRLPALVQRASAGLNPIRALIATHYDRLEESLVEQLDARACQGCQSHGLS